LKYCACIDRHGINFVIYRTDRIYDYKIIKEYIRTLN